MLDMLNHISYKLESNGTHDMTNIITAVILKRMNIDKTFLYKDFRVTNDSTLESISNEIYGSTKYWWVIMIVNNIIDPYNGLPMNNDLLVEFTRRKYGNENEIHWFIDSRSKRIEDDLSTIKWNQMYKANNLPEYILPVSHLDFEQEENQKKAIIKIVNPDYISVFEEIFKEMIN